MAEREVRIKFTGENGVLKGQTGELRTLFRNLTNDTDDVRSAGEKWAAAYSQQSARIRDDMENVTRSAAVLADSLGPEMVEALERSGRSVEEQVQELVKLGLTHDDIRESSDRLAAAIKERDDVMRQSTGQTGDGFRKVADEADRTRGVLANMVGNTAQDLGAIAGVGGAAGIAIGQMAEYATEGGISLANLAKMAGPMLGLGLAMGVVGNIMGDQKREAEELKRETLALESARQALADGEQRRAAESLLKEFEDEIDAAERYGLTTRQAVEALLGMGDGVEVLKEKLAGLRAEQERLRYGGLANDKTAVASQIGYIEDLVEALERSAAGYDSAGKSVDVHGARLDLLTDILGGATTAEEEHAQALSDAAKAAEDVERAQRDLNDARRAAIDTAFGVRDAEDQLIEARARADAAQDDLTTGVDEYRQAQDDAAQAALALADAKLRDAEATAAASGQTLTAAERNKVLVESLSTTLATLGPDSPLRQAIIDYIATLQGVPNDVNTSVTVTGTEDAATRIGGVQASADAVNETPVEVDAAADVDTAIGAVDRLIVKIGEVPVEAGTTFVMDTGAAMRDLDALIRKLRDAERAADDAERAVARVAD